VGDEIRMDKKTFEALTSDTRIGILKMLDMRQMTTTELASALEMAKSSVHEHLQKMVEAGLVEKQETERKWTYYYLTRKGRSILHPHETAKILILIGLSIVALATGVFGLISRMTRSAAKSLAMESAKAARGEALPGAPVEEPAPAPLVSAPMSDASSLIMAVILILAAFAMAYYAYRMRRRARPKAPTAIED
jgi:DNA-binding transcriptional ArsR family regulator